MYSTYGNSNHTDQTQTKVFEPYEYKYLNIDQLRERCFASIQDYAVEGETVQTKDGIYYYKDNGHRILAVAHLDTVQAMKKFIPVEGGRKIYNPQLDDRLGAYAILDLLPSLGLEYDVLLTEGEENGRSTARYFQPPEGKSYLWMLEIDRMGDDTVCYQYENEKLVKRLESVGCRVGIGSFTDISVLPHLGVQGMNFGCGYYNNHSTEAFMRVDQFEAQIEKIVAFYNKFKDTRLEYDPKTCGRRSWTKSYSTVVTPTHQSYQRGWEDWDGDQGSYTQLFCHTCKTMPCRCKNLVVVKQHCLQCGAVKDGPFCPDYCELIDSQCSICDDTFCLGLNRCNVCKYLHHNDVFIKKFGLCGDCISNFMNVDSKLITAYEDNRTQENLDNIGEVLFQ